MNKLKRILIITRYYLPDQTGGGIPRSLSTLVERLGDEFEFYILTLDRGFENQRYPDIRTEVWQPVGKANVMYVPPDHYTPKYLRRLFRSIEYDILYLSSCFAVTTRPVLLMKKLGLIPDKPTILAPRGEFSKGALRLEGYKKRPYLWLSKRIGFYDHIIWHACSEREKEDILTIMASRWPLNVIVASEFVADSPNVPVSLRIKKKNHARIVFLSRISRMKNLDYALRLLSRLSGTVEFDIYGPLEDLAYWQECQDLAEQLEQKVRIRYKGALAPDQVFRELRNYHLFLLPTRGENFGHVILEAMSVGCPVLISDQTPWHNLEDKKAGWAIPLTQPERFVTILQDLLAMEEAEFREWEKGASDYAREITNNPSVIESNRMLFGGALACH